MKSQLKHILVSLLPRPVRRRLRQWNGLRQVRGFTEDRWPCAPVVRSLVHPGDCVVDAGANMGYITALLARWVGARGRVHSIEPVPETGDLLECNVRALRLDQVQIHRCAVSDAEGAGTMEVPHYPQGGDNFYESHLVTAAGSASSGLTVQVPLRRLDDLVGPDTARIRFMKIDVEGHEGPVMRGALEILRRSQPALLIEVSGDPDEPASAAARLVRELAALGYRAYWWDGSLRARQAGDRAVDYFFLQEHHLSLIGPAAGSAGQREQA